MAKIGLPKASGKRLKVSEKSGNFEMDIEWQPCIINHVISQMNICILIGWVCVQLMACWQS